VALAAYVGGRRAPHAAVLPRGELIDLVSSELRDLVGAEGPPTIARVRQWPRGIPQLELGHGSRLGELQEALAAHPGMFLSGNYFEGVSVVACLERAAITAEKVASYLMASGLEQTELQQSQAEAAGS
jgi:oxygen-dependent protoporphyrinogen oxidase